MILYTKMKSRVRRMKPVFHTQMDASMAEMPRNTNTIVSDPLAKTFITYLTVMTDFSSMLELMYFWQHMPQKTILRRRTKRKSTNCWCLDATSRDHCMPCVPDGRLRENGGQGEHLRRQVGEVSQDEDEARLDDLDVLRAPGHKGNEDSKHKAKQGATKSHHKEGH